MTRASSIITTAILAVGAILATLPASADELFTNTTFADGPNAWKLLRSKLVPNARRGASSVVALDPAASATSPAGAVFTDVQPVPTERELLLRAMAKGTGKVGINVASSGQNHKTLGISHWEIPLTGSDWQPLTARFVVPRGTVSLRVVLYNSSTKPLVVAAPQLSTGTAKPADPAAMRSLGGPGIIRAIERAPVKTKPGVTGTVAFPIPGDYRDQVPLAFRIKSTPPDALKAYRWRKRPDGLNWLCEVSISTGPKGALIEYESVVLVGDRKPSQPPKTAKVQAPGQEVARWTRSTACVQSDDPGIKAKAGELAEGAEDIESYARKVIAFTRSNRGTGAAFNALDAKRALACGGIEPPANVARILAAARTGKPATLTAALHP